jgi:hypothetical protein
MSEMVERACRAFIDKLHGEGVFDTDVAKPIWLSAMAAAIAAMRKPTAEMSEAAYMIEASGHSQRTLMEAGWRTMIDAALKEESDA